jgi:hypothetical protein
MGRGAQIWALPKPNRIGTQMKLEFIATLLALAGLLQGRAVAEDITTLDGHTYTAVQDVTLKPNGLFFVTGTNAAMRGVTVPFDQLPEAVKQKYHYDPFDLGLKLARQDLAINMTKTMAFSLDNLEAAKARAKAEKKLLGFIMEWDSMYGPTRPMEGGSNAGFAHFYLAFHNQLVLVFVRHETELNQVPAAVKQGFSGPEEGGFAPNMAVVTADCSQFICEIPYGGQHSNGAIREQIFRQKMEVIKQFLKAQPQP